LYLSILEVDGMQIGENNPTSDIIRPLVMRSLRRSSVRKKIAEYLFEISPSGSYTSDIAYNVKTTPTNVIGAIRGMNSRYRNDESLIGLNIVEQIETHKNVKIYRLTDFGKDIVNSMKEKI
jgi:predicted transcriptional regulator with HTH domain